MNVFDAQSFDAHKIKGHYLHSLADGSEIEQWESPGEYYLEEFRKGRGNYSTYRKYYFDTRSVMQEGEQFFRFPIGIWRTYDKTGRVTHQIDHDAPFRVSIVDLQRITHQMGIEIDVRGNGVGVMRDVTPIPTYTVFFPDVPGDDSAIRFLAVDGISGKILSQVVKPRTKD
ncbi:MAG TPA: hypothetical protein VGV09_03845 [Steroidobacteraceae bacterium]|nr:hypothetical protein [Steroidobacteraceae bacterium]